MKRDIYNLYQDEVDEASDSDKVDAADDEEIDEEMVFNESDEERFGSFFPAKEDDSSSADDDDEQADGGNLSDLIMRENLQDLINADDKRDDQLDEFSDSESDRSVKDLSSIVSKKRKVLDLNAKQGEFTIPVRNKVSLSDMMENVQEETSFGALKRKLKYLDNTDRVDAPAATRIKNR
jgi:hypothetical protein